MLFERVRERVRASRLLERRFRAERKNIAIGMFNATGFDSLQAVIGAAEELGQPVIIAHAEVHNVYNDISFVGPAMIAAARRTRT